MAGLDWKRFAKLPGAPEKNFESLCRAVIRRHYGQFGDFRGLANQPGVEFHLQLNSECSLGKPGRWYGWQCKWYDLNNSDDLGATRRRQIADSIKKTVDHVPGVTDWVLWTKHILTKKDQEWFYGLASEYPQLSLSLNTSDDLEALLCGPAAILRDSYFGELVVTPQCLAEQYELAAAPYRERYVPDVHSVVPVENLVLECLGSRAAWEKLDALSIGLKTGAAHIQANIEEVPDSLTDAVTQYCEHAIFVADRLGQLLDGIAKGDLDAVRLILDSGLESPHPFRRLLMRLRSARSACSLVGTNLLADLFSVQVELAYLGERIDTRIVAVTSPAGGGKSELSLHICSPEGELPGGVLLMGNSLAAGQTLDDLVGTFKIAGKSAENIEQFFEAINSAGERAGQRIPIVVDGLNESEDPRNWKDILSKAYLALQQFPNLLLIVTLRDEFVDDCLLGQIETFQMDGFESAPKEAIDKYFRYYKIDASDVSLPIQMLQHPLTLKIFCEVANAERKRIVGVEALPRSMTGLLSEHVRRVTLRIADQSSASKRIYQEEVNAALRRFGKLLWDNNARAFEQKYVREFIDDAPEWDHSLIRKLESEGILTRVSDQKGRIGVAFTYDYMAGHILAEYLISQPDIGNWLEDSDQLKKLNFFEHEGSHTLAYDCFQAMVGLFPQRLQGQQFWQKLDEPMRSRALLLCARSEPEYICRDTTEAFSQEMLQSDSFSQSAFPYLKDCRAARAHPFDVNFPNATLREMTNTQRDLSWSEWLRRHQKKVVADVVGLDQRWSQGDCDDRDVARARWVMWVLTTNCRYLRDCATKALHSFALQMPQAFFDLAFDSLSISDPYVPERMFAAGYGAALCSWSCSTQADMRAVLPAVAKRIISECFLPDSPHPARHALLRQYLLGIVEIARRIDPVCVNPDHAKYLKPPFDHLKSSFSAEPSFSSEQIDEAEKASMHMDFKNYTIGRLVSDRQNYDFKNEEYVSVKRAILSRMLDLGYDPEKFSKVDRNMSSYSRHEPNGRKMDRYGKKYSWIAFFEMWAERADSGQLPDWYLGERPSDADIDPSFLGVVETWSPNLPDIFRDAPAEMLQWVSEGPTPDYSALLNPTAIDGSDPDWILLDGFIEETAAADYRNIFTFIRGVFVAKDDVTALLDCFESMKYPGNDAISSYPELFYQFAAEMPLAYVPGLNGLGEHNELETYRGKVSADRWGKRGVPVEIPVGQYGWESYHSALNSESGVVFPSPGICGSLGLGVCPGIWDLYDENGVASIFRQLVSNEFDIEGRATYLRKDCLQKYLSESNEVLVWLIWGERGVHYRAGYSVSDAMQEVYNVHQHIHKRSVVWMPE